MHLVRRYPSNPATLYALIAFPGALRLRFSLPGISLNTQTRTAYHFR